jgi:hypothetical protein
MKQTPLPVPDAREGCASLVSLTSLIKKFFNTYVFDPSYGSIKLTVPRKIEGTAS